MKNTTAFHVKKGQLTGICSLTLIVGGTIFWCSLFGQTGKGGHGHLRATEPKHSTAAEAPEASVEQGLKLLQKTNTHEEQRKGFELIQSAATSGSANGAFNLGVCFYRGLGCSKDEKLALKWLKIAAEGGIPDAMLAMGLLSQLPSSGQEYTEAFRWLQKAAQHGEKRAYLELAICHEKGIGTPNDPQAALKLYEKAVSLNVTGSENALGCYLLKHGEKTTDLERALKLFERALKAGDSHAHQNLKICKGRIKASHELRNNPSIDQ